MDNDLNDAWSHLRKGNSNSRSRRQSSIIAPSPLKSGSLHFPDGSFGAIGGDGLELDFNVEGGQSVASFPC
jgi:hypothetical protein